MWPGHYPGLSEDFPFLIAMAPWHVQRPGNFPRSWDPQSPLAEEEQERESSQGPVEVGNSSGRSLSEAMAACAHPSLCGELQGHG